MPEFVHLHNHSDYSLLDGAVTIKNLVSEAGKQGMKHLALTDHGNLFGALRFEQACHKTGINPVVGMEAYVAPGSCLIKSSQERKYYHLCLYCKNEKGYRNLIELASRGYLDGFYYKPRIDDALLEEFHEGIMASSACLAGEIQRKLLANDYEGAKDKAIFYENLFGKDNFYLEIMDHGLEDEKRVRSEIIKLSKDTGIPLIATNDIHYLKKDHANAQDILICIGTNRKKTDTNRMKMDTQEFYFKTPEEMEELFSDIPEALSNTVKLAERCDLTIPQPGPILPEYEIPEPFKGEDDYLKHITWAGIKDRYTDITDEIKERTEYELKVLLSMGFAGYFLIVWDFINWAKKKDIPVGPGRGSGAGSIIAYAMGITDVEPLKYDLLFERFLNPERVSMPDFDVDFCFERRGEVIDYVTQKYGREQVGGICTFGTLKTKAVLKDVARVLDIPFDESNLITKLIPEGKAPDGRKFNTAVSLEFTPELKEILDRGGVYEELFETAMILEGQNRHVSTHACGKVIGKSKLTDYVPLYKDQKTGEVSSEFTMDIIEPCGLVKMDFLGLKTLTLLKNTEKLVQKKDPSFNVDEVSEEDPLTFKMLGEGKSTAVFQFESAGMQKILKDAQPNNIEDLIALNALYRPGPMQFIPQYIEGKKNPKSIQFPDPTLEELLTPTYGVIVYQEQVMKVAQIIGGFSLGKADILRRAMGKKKVKDMEKMKVEFIAGAKDIGHDEKHASGIFDMLEPFAGYGFNKSHAAAYSVVAYKTAFCKANYPAEFMAANLTNEINSPDTFKDYLGATKEMGIDILPPDINLSEKNFTVIDGKIIYGLIGIKGMGAAAVEEIQQAREEQGSFLSLEDFLEKVGMSSVNKKTVESCIRGGLFDNVDEHNRATLLHNLENLLEIASKNRENKKYGQVSLFGECEQEVSPDYQYERVPDIDKKQQLDEEKEIIGFYISGHPMDKYKAQWKQTKTLSLLTPERALPKKNYQFLGMIKTLRQIVTKKGKKMLSGILEDFEGTIDFVLFPRDFDKFSYMFVEDSVVGLVGEVDLTRGNPQIKVTEAKSPDILEEKKDDIVHIRFSETEFDEDMLLDFRSLLIDNSGTAQVFLHMKRNNKKYIIKSSSQLTISTDKSMLDNIKSSPLVGEIWKE